MNKLLEDGKTFIVEVVTLIGGIIWTINSKWELEPIILSSVALIGVCYFILTKLFYSNENKPIIEIEMIGKGGTRSSPMISNSMKFRKNEGNSYKFEYGGIYLFQVSRWFTLKIRNNSKYVAYNIRLFISRDSYQTKFDRKIDTLEPLLINSYISLKISYDIEKEMTSQVADNILNSDIPKDLENLTLLIEYKNDSRKIFYSIFKPRQFNKMLTKKPNLMLFKEI